MPYRKTAIGKIWYDMGADVKAAIKSVGIFTAGTDSETYRRAVADARTKRLAAKKRK